MLECEDVILDKARIRDWLDMYENVWSRPESARYMFWKLTENEEDAYHRMERTIEFEKSHDAYLVYERRSGKAIGFAGAEKVSEGVCEEAGICLGPDYFRKGYGRQILQALIDHCREVYHARTFIYSSRIDNIASRKLAESMGFEKFDEISRFDERDGKTYQLIRYKKDCRN